MTAASEEAASHSIGWHQSQLLTDDWSSILCELLKTFCGQRSLFVIRVPIGLQLDQRRKIYPIYLKFPADLSIPKKESTTLEKITVYLA